ncbi:MAG: hypothetical protein LUG93_08045 [Lachnospiraceae bacterium]|nr:hypothetical protein [Lachnospiraceae bacterium]
MDKFIKRSLCKRVAELNAEAEQIQAEMMELDISADTKSDGSEADTRKGACRSWLIMV